MKKLLSVILAIAIMMTLSISAFALSNEDATDDTTLTMNVGVAYTVTIPANVSIADAGEGYVGSAEISIADGYLLPTNTKLEVTLSVCDFTLSCGNDNVAYTVNGKSELAQVGVVATFAPEADDAATVAFAVPNTPTVAGEYTDSITFAIATAAIA